MKFCIPLWRSWHSAHWNVGHNFRITVESTRSCTVLYRNRQTHSNIYIYIYIYIYIILVVLSAGLNIEKTFPEFNLISFFYSVMKNRMLTFLFTKLNSCNRSMQAEVNARTAPSSETELTESV
jgi:hypothetical protein